MRRERKSPDSLIKSLNFVSCEVQRNLHFRKCYPWKIPLYLSLLSNSASAIHEVISFHVWNTLCPIQTFHRGAEHIWCRSACLQVTLGFMIKARFYIARTVEGWFLKMQCFRAGCSPLSTPCSHVELCNKVFIFSYTHRFPNKPPFYLTPCPLSGFCPLGKKKKKVTSKRGIVL